LTGKISEITVAISKAKQLTEYHADIFIDIAYEDIECMFDDIYVCVERTPHIFSDTLYKLAQIAVADKGCWDVSSKLLALAKRHHINITEMESDIEELKKRNN